MQLPIQLGQGETVPGGGEDQAPRVVLQPGGQPLPQGEQVVLLEDVGGNVEHRQLTILWLTEGVLAGQHCSHLGTERSFQVFYKKVVRLPNPPAASCTGFREPDRDHPIGSSKVLRRIHKPLSPPQTSRSWCPW